MADETVQKIRTQKGKITLADVGIPGNVKIAERRDSKGRYLAGVLLGRAEGFLVRSNLKAGDGQPDTFEGLRGTFISQPSDPNMDEMESGVLFIPDAYHNLLAGKLREAQKKDPSAAIEFALNIYSIEAKNPAGYSWIVEPREAFVGQHPLDNLMKRVAALPKPEAAKQIAGRK